LRQRVVVDHGQGGREAVAVVERVGDVQQDLAGQPLLARGGEGGQRAVAAGGVDHEVGVGGGVGVAGEGHGGVGGGPLGPVVAPLGGRVTGADGDLVAQFGGPSGDRPADHAGAQYRDSHGVSRLRGSL